MSKWAEKYKEDQKCQKYLLRNTCTKTNDKKYEEKKEKNDKRKTEAI